METVEVKVGNRVILIDKDDLTLFTNNKWNIYLFRKLKPYVRLSRTKVGIKAEYMHRMILKITDPKIHVDHINGNSLDNRKSNLRICNRAADDAIKYLREFAWLNKVDE